MWLKWSFLAGQDFLKRDSEWFITIQNRNYEKIDASYTFHSVLN